MPLEYYNFDGEDLEPEALLNKYRDKKTGEVEAFSKYYDNHGGFEWKPCTVETFDTRLERFIVHWKHNNRSKYVSR